MLSSWEETIENEIKNWYQSIDAKYFDHKPWHHLYDEERQTYTELFWETKLKD